MKKRVRVQGTIYCCLCSKGASIVEDLALEDIKADGFGGRLIAHHLKGLNALALKSSQIKGDMSCSPCLRS